MFLGFFLNHQDIIDFCEESLGRAGSSAVAQVNTGVALALLLYMKFGTWICMYKKREINY